MADNFHARLSWAGSEVIEVFGAKCGDNDFLFELVIIIINYYQSQNSQYHLNTVFNILLCLNKKSDSLSRSRFCQRFSSHSYLDVLDDWLIFRREDHIEVYIFCGMKLLVQFENSREVFFHFTNIFRPQCLPDVICDRLQNVELNIIDTILHWLNEIVWGCKVAHNR